MRSAIVLFLFALVSSTANADPDASSAAAKQHFQGGVAQFKDGDYRRALAEFEASYSARAVPDVLYNIALTQEAMGRYVAALATFERFLSDKPALAPARKQEIERRMRMVSSRLGNLRLRDLPTEARVVVDGVERKLPGPWSLDPGVHDVELDGPCGSTAKRQFAIQSGKDTELALALNTKCDAHEEVVSSTPVETSPAPTPLPPRRESAPATRRAAIATGVLAGAALVAGAAMGGVALARRSSYDQACDGGACDPSLFDSAHRLSIGADVLFGVAAASAIVTIVLAVIHPRHEAPRVSVAPWSRAGGLALGVRF